MCLIGLAIDPPGPWLLVVAANRDEFHDRHTAAAAYWHGSGANPGANPGTASGASSGVGSQASSGAGLAPALLAGRDLQAGGTWLGLRRSVDGASLRIGALTNLRPGLMPTPAGPGQAAGTGNAAVPPSRGQLVASFLCADAEPESFLNELEPSTCAYAGFNLLALAVHGARADVDAWYLNNLPGSVPRRLGSGIHVVSNATLDVAWPKTRLLHRAMTKALCGNGGQSAASLQNGRTSDARRLAGLLLEALADPTQAPEAELPRTDLDSARERLLSAPFIVDDHYGTRCSTVIAISRDREVLFCERSFGPGGRLLGMVTEQVPFALR